MLMGRNKSVMNDALGRSHKKVMPHDEFIERIRKSLYFGNEEKQRKNMPLEISRPLAEYASDLFSEPHRGYSLNRLNVVAAGNCHAAPCSLIMALIYLDRLNALNPEYARRITPQELFIVSMMISTKFYSGYDEVIYLSDWAQDGDMTDERLIELELQFLTAIDWNVYVSNEQFFEKLVSVEKTLARREGLRRGWLTYTELIQMLPSFTLIKFLLNNIAVMAVSYAASVMTIAGAFFLVSQIPGSAWHHERSDLVTTETNNCTNSTIILPATAPPTSSPNDTVHATVYNCYNNTRRRLRGTGRRSGVVINATEQLNIDEDVEAINAERSSCMALNVEMELLKLERRYREEAEREQQLKRQSETVSNFGPEGGDGVGVMNVSNMKTSSNAQMNDITFGNEQRTWFAFKERYSNAKPPSSSSTFPARFTDCSIANWANCSRALLWDLLSVASHQTYMRPPTVWFKFM